MSTYAIESRSPLFPRPVHLAFGLIVLAGAIALLIWTERRAVQEHAAIIAAEEAHAPAPQIVFGDQPATPAATNSHALQTPETIPAPASPAPAEQSVPPAEAPEKSGDTSEVAVTSEPALATTPAP